MNEHRVRRALDDPPEQGFARPEGKLSLFAFTDVLDHREVAQETAFGIGDARNRNACPQDFPVLLQVTGFAFIDPDLAFIPKRGVGDDLTDLVGMD